MDAPATQVGVVTQEPTLFQASVLDNIRCADPNATEADVEQACKDAFIHDVIRYMIAGVFFFYSWRMTICNSSDIFCFHKL